MADRKKKKYVNPENKDSDPNDVSHIYEKYHSELKGFISKRVAFKEDAEDILQNVFYSLSKIDLVQNPIEQVSSWLYSVAKNQIIDRNRKKKEERLPQLKSNSDDDDFIADISDLLSDKTNDPEMKYLQSTIWKELNQALNELPLEQRTVYELTEMQGFSFKEISNSTGIPVNTLISRKRYAILHLRERLNNFYVDMFSN